MLSRLMTSSTDRESKLQSWYPRDTLFHAMNGVATCHVVGIPVDEHAAMAPDVKTLADNLRRVRQTWRRIATAQRIKNDLGIARVNSTVQAHIFPGHQIDGVCGIAVLHEEDAVVLTTVGSRETDLRQHRIAEIDDVAAGFGGIVDGH